MQGQAGTILLRTFITDLTFRGLNCFPQKTSSIPPNVTLFGNQVVADIHT